MKYYTMKQIVQSQEYMQKRGQRKLRGEVRAFPGECGFEALYYDKKSTRRDYVIVEVHGGGFMYNTARDDDDLCAYIHERLKIPVVACDYRRAPQYKYPTGVEDVFACVKHVYKEYGLKQGHVLIWGHSAGANLAAGAAFMDKQSGVHAIGSQILDYPYMDVYRKSKERQRIRLSVKGKLMDTFAYYYTEEQNLKKPMVSPELMKVEMLEGMPDTYLLLCGRDNLNQGGKSYGKLLRKAGTYVEFCYERDALHGFIENHFNYAYIDLKTKWQNRGIQRKLAVKHTDKICDGIQSKIQERA